MRIVVCVRQLKDGEINPFDASAYETALQIEDVEVILLSMGPISVKDFLSSLTRLGAKSAVLLCDKCFAGADTLATSYTLSLALKKLSPDLVICGRQTVDGDTGQVGPEIAIINSYNLVTNVMTIKKDNEEIVCTLREGDTKSLVFPSLITVEKFNTLRLPSIRSKTAIVEIWDANILSADVSRCGILGSPTKVMKTFENEQDRRKCTFIKVEELPKIIEESLKKERVNLESSISENSLKNVFIVGNAPYEMAKTISDDITEISLDTPEKMAELIKEKNPKAVLFGSDLESKKIAPQVAALLKTGLCADCTKLETDGEDLFMYRPAFSGNVIAKIQCKTTPIMATVRTTEKTLEKIIVGIGFGVKEQIEDAKKFANRLNASIVATRKMVDNDYMPYDTQVGLTGKSVSPRVYIAVGISGAVHHIAGVKQSGTIIAINKDENAPIFKYADYGIVKDISFEDLL